MRGSIGGEAGTQLRDLANSGFGPSNDACHHLARRSTSAATAMTRMTRFATTWAGAILLARPVSTFVPRQASASSPSVGAWWRPPLSDDSSTVVCHPLGANTEGYNTVEKVGWRPMLAFLPLR